MIDLDIAREAALAAQSRKAERLSVLDMRGRSDVCHVQLLCSGTNDNQTRAIATAIEEACQSKLGVKPIAIEGKQSGHWILLDYGGFMAHIFLAQLRDYYAIEELWPGAPQLLPNLVDR